MINKKGISPLTATFMLLGFAFILGFIVMQLGRSIVGEQFGVTTSDENVPLCVQNAQEMYNQGQITSQEFVIVKNVFEKPKP